MGRDIKKRGKIEKKRDKINSKKWEELLKSEEKMRYKIKKYQKIGKEIKN